MTWTLILLVIAKTRDLGQRDHSTQKTSVSNATTRTSRNSVEIDEICTTYSLGQGREKLGTSEIFRGGGRGRGSSGRLKGACVDQLCSVDK